MKYIMTLGLIAVIVTVLYFGYIMFMGKTMHQEDTGPKTVDLTQLEKEQSQRVKDLKEQQKRLMEERQMRMRDMQRN